jgi:putative NADH-flavin reductase
MKLVVFGATGGTGSQLVERALAVGHDVAAVARRPEAIARTHDRLRVVKGDVLDAASVAACVAGADAVLSAIGPANNKQPGTLISDGAKHIVAACAQHGVRRFVFESGIMVGDGRGLSWLGRRGVAMFRFANRALCADKRIAEDAIRASELDWVIVRPVSLIDGAATGSYVTGVDARVHVAKKLSHADVAHFMVECATNPAVVRTIQDIGH